MTQYSWQRRDTDLISLFEKISADDPAIFTELFDATKLSRIEGPLSGALVSIKATFDVKGFHSSGGSKLLGIESADQDAKAVERLTAAGATLVGHTNMTELAYSGLGLNPHFGTPANPIDALTIPGGSTSGGAVSVAKGFADIALGTDTGGSLRIPAAFCGLTGFKPSQQSVSRIGCLPLSDSLDSVGPIASSVQECRIAWEVLSGQTVKDIATDNIKFIVPTNFGFDGIDDGIAALFNDAVTKIKQAGFDVIYEHVDLLETYKTLPVWHFSAVESRRHYRTLFDLESDELDPRVRSRIKKGESVTDDEFAVSVAFRNQLVSEFSQQFANSVLLMPTVAIQAPRFADLESDADYDRINLLCLRNTSVANVFDACSISLPHKVQSVVGGVLLTMPNGNDAALLTLAETLQSHL
ncbi:amidase family protein [Vibrio viridaestus]|uniref:Amidase n=1 Tax=Vibrio viridaestus TaxID=2487322 RepID=A0A3N9TEE4_9VIBR|nr:amidase family protein [Vibrio viridaestus]RQW62601.1 amidase [Vibrio viridaestus]